LLQNARVISLETRHGSEAARLIEKLGGTALQAPSLREIPLEDQAEALSFADELLAGKCDVLVLLTGVGTQALFDAMATKHPREALLSALGRTALVCRGPKPQKVLKELELTPRVVAPEPNTSETLLRQMAQELKLEGQRVFIQEYGAPNPELIEGLKAAGASVGRVPVYAWQLPEDVEPLRRAVRAIAEQTADAILFTSARQLVHLMQVAGELGLSDAVKRGLSRLVVASIGPVTSAALAEQGIGIDTEPEHAKLGQLITHLAKNWNVLRARKRAES
jgi:uroporphyrinogen-III synthase